ncbi:MAG: helix-turn-helix domain-containing protein [Proteobacteria bacterium]|jgi:hypothetical protein|nr:helix-turn-helix domain-containing protein [Pseudomonadota bacterium]
MDTDWISVAEAAHIAERSKPTIRRWTRRGHIEAHPGPVPAHGGSRPTMINRDSLMVYLATSQQIPREVTSARTVVHDDNALGVGTVTPGDHQTEKPPTLEQVQVEAVVSILEVKLEAAQNEAAHLRQRIRDLELLVNDTRQERDDWRDRHDAREAELRVLRTEHGLPWWRKLIGVRPVYELPDSAVEVVQ